MGLQPKIDNRLAFYDKTCACCGKHYDATGFLKSKSIISHDGYSDVCKTCIKKKLEESNYNWQDVDLMCQYLNVPFIPDVFERQRKLDAETGFEHYVNIFNELQYENLNWKQYWSEFKKLEKANVIDQEMPLIKDNKIEHLQEKWGSNYSVEQLSYLENLYSGMMVSQNINGALQVDQAKKLCKTSLEIDERIRAGADYDKMLSSYEKLVKIAEFTPKNAKNAADFDSVGELFHWLEKRGWKNSFYDDVTRDIVDETIKNIQNYNQRLYVNETGIGEEISRRIEALQHAAELETTYETNKEYDLDNFDNDGFEELFKEEEFKEEI